MLNLCCARDLIEELKDEKMEEGVDDKGEE